MQKCPTCGRTKTRSSEANRRYWAIIHAISEKPVQGVLYSPDTWHLYCKQRFLGSRDVDLPNGKTITVPISTAGLDVSEFNDYMTKVEVFANDHGIYLEE